MSNPLALRLLDLGQTIMLVPINNTFVLSISGPWVNFDCSEVGFDGWSPWVSMVGTGHSVDKWSWVAGVHEADLISAQEISGLT